MAQHNQPYRIMTVVALALLLLSPLLAEATSHSLAQLCTKITCAPALITVPKIEKVFLSNVRPGGFVAIAGRRFGSTRGRLVLKLQSGHEVDLTHLEWSDGFIGGHIPCTMVMIPTLRDQKATLRVVAKYGAVSNAWPAQFSAQAVESLLPMRDTKRITCSTDASYNHCNDLADGGGGGLVASGQYRDDRTFDGIHSNDWGTGAGAGIGTDKGIDIYEYRLANGWVFTSTDFTEREPELGEGSVSFVKGCPKGGSSCSASVQWVVTPWDTVFYHARVHICGPPGTKWK
jgi:hypothetical protein